MANRSCSTSNSPIQLARLNVAEEGEATELAGTREGRRGVRKSNIISTTPLRMAVTHFDKQRSKCKQVAPKKS
jgi:hypothetical protein